METPPFFFKSGTVVAVHDNHTIVCIDQGIAKDRDCAVGVYLAVQYVRQHRKVVVDTVV
jgi:hypothetical protein